MRRISTVTTALIASFVMTLSGLAASSVATASVKETLTISFSFSAGSSVLTKSQKVKIKKIVANSGTDATFRVTGAAGKLPGVSDGAAQLLAKKRGQVVKAYLVKLGVKKSNITIKVKITRFGILPRTKLLSSYSDASPSPSTSPTTPVALSCATGGTCVVGNTGPGGGIVYYVDSSAGGFACGPTLEETCNYLEVAASGWSGVPADPLKAWAVPANASTDSGVINEASANNSGAGIGLGYKNSIAIETQNGPYNASTNSYAAGAALEYASNSKSDWYLPTTAELNLLCQWGRNVTQVVGTACIGGALNTGTGVNAGLMEGGYLSSSEIGESLIWNQFFQDNLAFPYNQFMYGKGSNFYVRPVRAF
jgi:hypothetical protein